MPKAWVRIEGAGNPTPEYDRGKIERDVKDAAREARVPKADVFFREQVAYALVDDGERRKGTGKVQRMHEKLREKTYSSVTEVDDLFTAAEAAQD